MFLKYKCYPICRTIRKSHCFQEISVPINSSSSEKGAVPKSTFSKKVHALNNYIFCRKRSSKTVPALKKYLSSRSS